MSFLYGIETWTPKSSSEHAEELLSDINNTLTGLGYAQSELLKASNTNAVWIMLLAQGNLRAEYDNLLYEAQNSLDPALCSDDQFLNLLPIAGTELILGNYTTVEVTITASSEGDVVIPANSEMPFSDDVSFFTINEEITILSEETETITLTSNVREPITVLENQLIEFSNTIDNIETITSARSIEGSYDETIVQCRNRVIQGKTFNYNTDGLVNELINLDGISSAKAYFNPDSIVNLEIPGGIEVLPRTLAVFILGDSEYIGQTIWNTLMLKTQGDESQTITTLSGQDIYVYYYYAEEIEGYAKIYIPYGVTLSYVTQTQLKNLVAGLTLDVGESMKAAKLDQLFDNYEDVVGCEVSLDDITYGLEAIVDANNYVTIPLTNITIENLEE